MKRSGKPPTIHARIYQTIGKPFTLRFDCICVCHYRGDRVGGLFDGHEILFLVFYLMSVALAVWFVGKGFGVLVSSLSVAVWVAGDFASGARFANPLIPIWNALVLLTFYLVVVWL